MGTGVYLHRGNITGNLLYFQPGDVLGMLMRLNRSSDFAPLLMRSSDATGLSVFRNGPFPDNATHSASSVTFNSPLLSLELCEFHSLHTNCILIAKFRPLLLQVLMVMNHILTVLT